MASKKKAARRRRKRIGTGQDKVDRINRMVSIVEALADAVENLPDKKPLQEIEIFQATEKLHEQLKRIHG
jgi:hypothetical protein